MSRTIHGNITKLEVQIMRGTNHPSIVKLYSFSESQEHYFLVLEGGGCVLSDPPDFF